jgi:hypothetical protein
MRIAAQQKRLDFRQKKTGQGDARADHAIEQLGEENRTTG